MKTSFSKTEIGKRIAEIRKKVHKTQSEFATILGYQSKSGINQIESGLVDVPMSKIHLIASVGQVDVDWLLYGESPVKMNHTNISIPETKGLFPVVSIVGAGIVTPYDNEPTEYMALPYKGMGVVLKVQGDSMQGVVNDGDHVLVSVNKLPSKGHIAAVRTFKGEQFIKYYNGLIQGMHFFYSHNAIYKPESIPLEEIEVMRKVVLIIRDTDYPEST